MHRRRRPAATLDDVVEVLHGIGVILMAISAKLEEVIELLGGNADEEADA
jgi:hypothetical protein